MEEDIATAQQQRRASCHASAAVDNNNDLKLKNPMQR
jgi:hypothetical protein